MSLRGFWDPGLLAAFAQEVRVALDHKPQPTFRGICDISALLVQPAKIVDSLQGLMNHVRAAGMRNGAIVVNSSLLRLQASRAVDLSRTRFVATLEEAHAWLAESASVDVLA